MEVTVLILRGIAYALAVVVGYVVASEGVYNIRRVASIGSVYPRSGVLMLVMWGLALVINIFLYRISALAFAIGGLCFCLGVIVGLPFGLRADPTR
jgi:hypothetical protein